MLELAAREGSAARFVQGDALELPVRGRRVRTRVHELLLRPSRGGRPRRLSRRGAPRRGRARGRRLRARTTAVEPGEWQERVLNDGSRWQVYKRYFDRRRARRGARRRPVAARGPLVRRRERVTRRAQRSLPLARVASARQPRLPRLRRGRLPARVAAGRRAAARASAPTCSARRRASSRARSAARGAAAPARRFAAGSSSTRTSSTRRSTAPPSRAATRAGALGTRRPDADSARAGALLLLARVGAPAAAARS